MAHESIDNSSSGPATPSKKPTVSNSTTTSIKDALYRGSYDNIEGIASTARMSHLARYANKYNHINRFRNVEGTDYFSSGIAYVFMTKPHLNLAKQKDIYDPFLRMMRDGNSELCKQTIANLDAKYGNGDGKFINIITNSAETFETKDNILKTKEDGETWVGDKIVFGDNQTESLGADTFNIEYTEYNDMALTYLHKTWVDYIHAVKRNKLHPYKSTDTYNTGGCDYVQLKIIDYVSSVYYFVLDPDGHTIRYFSKYTGVFPTSIPYSAMSFKLGDSNLRKLNITYQYSFKEDLDPRILDEFAALSGTVENDFTYINDGKLHNNWRSGVAISENRKHLYFKFKS